VLSECVGILIFLLAIDGVAFGTIASERSTIMIPLQLHRRIPLVRRPFYQRDMAIAERDRAAIELARVVLERDELTAKVVELQRLRVEKPLTWLRHRPGEHSVASTAVAGQPAGTVSKAFIARITHAYRAAMRSATGDAAPSMWSGPLMDVKHRERAILADGSLDEIKLMLSQPTASMLCYGFDEIMAHVEGRNDPASILVNSAEWLYDNLRRLAEAVGAIRLSNPENYYYQDERRYDVEQLLTALDDQLGIKITFPNPYPGEVGIASSRGVISYRAVQAIYQAHRVVTLSKNPRVLEIGAGLGRTAFYLKQFGVTDYVAIDIPLSNVAQAHFLGSILGETAVSLYGEAANGFSIQPDSALQTITDHFDVVLNVDSLTEMARETADEYWRFIECRCGAFLSINHEANPFAVRDLSNSRGPHKVTRNPYWMRRGYVEEVVTI
jgi:SAM-dependent methyltransferase